MPRDRDIKDWYGRLGVLPSASQEVIDKVHRDLAAVYHPDRWRTASEEERKHAEEKAKDINEAYDVIGDPDNRRVYDAELAERNKCVDRERAEEKAKAEKDAKYTRIRDLYERGDFEGAVREAELLFRSFPHDGLCQNNYAALLYEWAKRLAENGDLRNAEAQLRRAAKHSLDDEFTARIRADLELLRARSKRAVPPPRTSPRYTVDTATPPPPPRPSGDSELGERDAGSDGDDRWYRWRWLRRRWRLSGVIGCSVIGALLIWGVNRVATKANHPHPQASFSARQGTSSNLSLEKNVKRFSDYLQENNQLGGDFKDYKLVMSPAVIRDASKINIGHHNYEIAFVGPHLIYTFHSPDGGLTWAQLPPTDPFLVNLVKRRGGKPAKSMDQVAATVSQAPLPQPAPSPVLGVSNERRTLDKTMNILDGEWVYKDVLCPVKGRKFRGVGYPNPPFGNGFAVFDIQAYDLFTAYVGIWDGYSCRAKLIITVDDVEVFRRDMREGDAAQYVEIPLTGHKRIRLERQMQGDGANFLMPTLIRRKLDPRREVTEGEARSPLGTVKPGPRAAPPAQRGLGEAKLYLNEGEGDCLRGNFDKAIDECSKAIELDPTLAKAYTYRGSAFNGKGDFDKAIADCSKAIEFGTTDYEAYHNRGISYYGKRDYDKAIADWSKAIELKPKNPWPYKDRGGAYCAKGDYDKAWADVKKCQALGGTVDRDNLEILCKASGRSE
jgi:tetratricopeptide (TPR) repeat protein